MAEPRAPRRSLTADVDVPERVAKRPTWRGIPIPFTVPIPDDWNPTHPNRPAFEATDPLKWESCVRERLCGVCGEELDYWIFFVGGPKSMRSRLFVDPAMHEECAHYSVQACPYLSGRSEYASDETLERRSQRDGLDRVEMDHRPNERVERIGIGRTRRYEVRRQMNVDEHGIPRPRLLIRAASFKRIEWVQRASEDAD